MVAPQVTNLEPHEFIRGSSQIVNHTLYLTVHHGPALFRSGLWPIQVRIRDEALNP